MSAFGPFVWLDHAGDLHGRRISGQTLTEKQDATLDLALELDLVPLNFAGRIIIEEPARPAPEEREGSS